MTCLPFLQERSFIFRRQTVVSSKFVSDAIYPKNRQFFPMKLRYVSETRSVFFFFNSN